MEITPQPITEPEQQGTMISTRYTNEDDITMDDRINRFTNTQRRDRSRSRIRPPLRENIYEGDTHSYESILQPGKT